MPGKIVSLALPYPHGLSINHYYKRCKSVVILDKKVKNYREEIYYKTIYEPRFGKELVEVCINMHPPDNRKRDIDNILKAILDALQYSGIYDDDNQIISLSVKKLHVVENGLLEVRISDCSHDLI